MEYFELEQGTYVKVDIANWTISELTNYTYTIEGKSSSKVLSLHHFSYNEGCHILYKDSYKTITEEEYNKQLIDFIEQAKENLNTSSIPQLKF